MNAILYESFFLYLQKAVDLNRPAAFKIPLTVPILVADSFLFF